MEQTLKVLYDGETLRPEEPLNLEPNEHYIVTIKDTKLREKPSNRTLGKILERTTDLGISDLAENHDHYLYRADKR